MDVPYLAKVTKLNVAALAALASAPPPPEPTVEGAVSTDTTLKWPLLSTAESFVVRWRRTDANQWQHELRVAKQLRADTPDTVVLPHIRVDDWVFGVSSVSKDGYESPVASAVPGGAFKPYVAPPPAAPK